MTDKVEARRALQFFKENIIMISSIEAKREEGCALKCLDMLERYVEQNCKTINKESEVSE